ncbi:hypothetical protein CHS0354_022494 [Potamilus streckersoni]|uniref:Translation initiation factor eIF2B subunit gamma n=1 Tax=Potamilus streckersoni TaxID=2493646 RepID=A0AAE0W3N6_9BIVA|nr:hypothetical protein CHS0354_022494 [Potamilus streckersoni]
MEFQPVVMAAGRGSRMTDLTCKSHKALLPIGNMPMMWYPINMLEMAGFTEAIVVVLDSFATEAQKVLTEICDVKMRLDFIGIPDTEYWGTADVLRHIKDRIKTDVLIISSDLISDVSIHDIANVHRTYDATITSLLSNIPEQYNEIPAPGPKSKKKPEKDYIGLDEKGCRVLFYTPEADLDAEKVKISKSLLKRHPCVSIKSNLTDCHLYLMKKWVIDFLMEKRSISSIKGELLPYLTKKQFSKPKREDLPNTDASVLSANVAKDIFSFISQDPMLKKVEKTSTWIDHTGDMDNCYHGNQIRCYAYLQSSGFCARTNTVSSYCEINKQIPRLLQALAPEKEIPTKHSSAVIKGTSQVGSECLVGEGVTIGDKVSIKRSVIGKHCTVGDKVKITNSVILDHVNIGECCNIQGSIVSSNSHIIDKSDLKDCIVGTGENVKGKYTNEALTDVHRMIEI